MLSEVRSFGVAGCDGYPVRIEADVYQGLPAFSVVGLPDASVMEARDRVRAAMKQAGFSFPAGRVVLNLAPADRKKSGPLYDLPIFIALLKAVGGLSAETDGCAFVGELSLSGGIRPVRGLLPMALCAKEQGVTSLFVPLENAQELRLVEGLSIYPAGHVNEVLAHLKGERPLDALVPDKSRLLPGSFPVDFSEVRGQQAAKRALEIAAAGGHHILMIGPPGAGKSMLAARIPTILPPMDEQEVLEVTKLYSVAGLLKGGVQAVRPFRSPHHTISAAGLAGGGAGIAAPGELSLAHRGVLFLDELPEFGRQVTELLRQPLETGSITLSRAGGTVTYPCRFLLAAAMNPCPCGYYGHPERACTCTDGQIAKYLHRVSGPLLDRIDLHVEVAPVHYTNLAGQEKEESSAAIRQRVMDARERQRRRYEQDGIRLNAQLTPALQKRYCRLDGTADAVFHQAFDRLGLSARAYGRVLRVARTIADLDGAQNIGPAHILEAVGYRDLDRKYWNKA